VLVRITDASLEHDRQVEKREMDWLAAASHTRGTIQR
jgi:hypothetical protein